MNSEDDRTRQMHRSADTTTLDAQHFDAFATPLHLPEQPWERQVLASATPLGSVAYADDLLPVHAWGAGPPVILAHGWGARASHMGALARAIAAAGFTAVAYDGPAHTPAAVAGTVRRHATLVDFARALVAVTELVGPAHAVIGHSMGGASAALTVSGFVDDLATYAGTPLRRTTAPRTAPAVGRLVLVSAPDRLANAVSAWAARSGSGPAAVESVRRETLRRFSVPIEAFSVSSIARRLPARTLLVHDDGDTDVPIAEARRVDRALGGGRLEVTTGLGHGRTLIDAGVAERIVTHLRAA